MGKSTISMAFFNSYVSLPEGNGYVTDDDLFGWTSLYEKGIQHDLNTIQTAQLLVLWPLGTSVIQYDPTWLLYACRCM